jgi:hypothetical protein
VSTISKMSNHEHRYSSVTPPYEVKCTKGHWHTVEGKGFSICYCGQQKELVVEYVCPFNILIEDLAGLLCQHAQVWGYDHGSGPTMLGGVSYCSRHLAMAAEIVR